MSLFVKLYDTVLDWSKHRYATKYLAILSFVESFFAPIPPDVMLAPMILAQRTRAFNLAFITSIFSVAGGVFGYMLGYLAFEPIVKPLLIHLNYYAAYESVLKYFSYYGFWFILIAGFTPIPYKLFTLSAGVARISFPGFILASIIGRSARFYLVAIILYWGGENAAAKLRKYVNTIGYIFLLLLISCWLLKTKGWVFG